MDVELPDELMNTLFPDTSDAPAKAPKPEAKAESPDDLDLDISDEETLEDEIEETDDDEAGDDEPDEVEEEDEEEESDEETDDEDLEEEDLEDEPDEEDSFLPAFDRKKIEADPELSKAYKHMQASYTKKMQGLGEREREVSGLQEELVSFRDMLATPEGAQDFLVKVALAKPEIFEAAYEQAARLSENTDELTLYQREQKVREQEKASEKRQRAAEAAQAEARAAEVVGTAKRLADRAGLTDDDFEIVERFVAEKILENHATTGKRDVTDQEIKQAVLDARAFVRKQAERFSKETERRIREEQNERVKKKVKASKKPQPARSTRAPAVKSKKAATAPPGVDPFDWAIDQGLAKFEM